MAYELHSHLKPILKELQANTFDFKTVSYLLEPLMPKELRTKDFFSRIVDFENDTIRSANHGGGFACIHQRAGETTRPIEIYTNNLTHTLSVFTPEEFGMLNTYFYTPEELLVCLFTNRVCVFNQHGQIIDDVELFSIEEGEFFEFACFQEYSFFVVTNRGNIFYINSYTTFSCEKFAHFDIWSYDNVTAQGCAFCPADTCVYIDGNPTGNAEILWITASKGSTHKLICVQKDNVQETDFPFRVDRLFCSPDLSKICVVGDDQLFVFDKHFKSNLASFSIPNIEKRRLCWCGNSALIVSASQKLVLISLDGKAVNIPIAGQFGFVSEIDGARIITNKQIYYLRQVSGTSLDLIKRKKKNPALKLVFNASQKLVAAQEDVTETIPQLSDAISSCLDAVIFFRNVNITRLLLELVVRTKINIEQFDFQRFSEIIMIKRITDQLSDAPVSMPLTSAQYQALGSDHLLMRLCNRYQHFVAYRIADYLNVNFEPLYNNWAHSLIFSNAPNEVVINALKKSEHSFDYVQLATAAYKRKANGRSGTAEEIQKENLEFAKQLIDLNSVKARSLPLLIMWRAWDMAIEASVESNDTSLIMYTLKVIQQTIQELRQAEMVESAPNSENQKQSDSSTKTKKMFTPFFKQNSTKVTFTSNETSASLQKKINQVLLNHPIALEAAIMLNPDDPTISDLLAKSGDKKGAVNRDMMNAIHDGFDDSNITTKLDDVKKKAAKLNDTFGQKYSQHAIDMVSVCRDLSLPVLSTPLEVLDAVIRKTNGKVSRTIMRKLNITENEVLVRKLEIAFDEIMKGQDATDFKKVLKHFHSDYLIAFGKEMFRQRRFSFAEAIMNNTENRNVFNAMKEFDTKYQVISF